MPKCEICKLSLREGEGFIVNTRQVVTVPSFWEGCFTEAILGLRRKFKADIPQIEADKKFKYYILKECHKETGWLICSGCLTNFPDVNRKKAEEYAGEFWKSGDKENYRNPDTGAAPVEDAVKTAAPIWKRMSGREPPEVKDNRPISDTKKKGCFIATACYGDYNCREVRILRNFRDNILDRTTLGRQFIDLYYNISPPVADFIDRKPCVKDLIRRVFLNPIVALVSRSFIFVHPRMNDILTNREKYKKMTCETIFGK